MKKKKKRGQTKRNDKITQHNRRDKQKEIYKKQKEPDQTRPDQTRQDPDKTRK